MDFLAMDTIIEDKIQVTKLELSRFIAHIIISLHL